MPYDVGVLHQDQNLRFEATIIPTKNGMHLAAEICRSIIPRSRGIIIFVHGFCGNKHENGLFRCLAASCSAKGYHTVLYDWRGIGHSQGDFRSTTLREHVIDFQSVVKWTRARFQESLGPLCVVGFSLGAAIVGLALRRGTALNRVAYLSPAVRPKLSMWPRYNSEHIRREIADRGFVEKPGSAVLLGQAILNSLRDTDLGPQAFDIRVPLLVCHGTEDSRIDCSHTRELVAQRGHTPDFRYIEFDGASHSFQPADMYWPRLVSELVSWFNATSQPREKRVRIPDDSSEVVAA